MTQHAEVENDDGADDGKKDEQELALLQQVGLAGGVDGVSHIAHRGSED